MFWLSFGNLSSGGGWNGCDKSSKLIEEQAFADSEDTLTSDDSKLILPSTKISLSEVLADEFTLLILGQSES